MIIAADPKGKTILIDSRTQSSYVTDPTRISYLRLFSPMQDP
jgi:hypothetical protein